MEKHNKVHSSLAIAARLVVVLVMAVVAGLLSSAQPVSADDGPAPYTCPDGTTPSDNTGDGVVDIKDCTIEVVDPDLRGNVSVKAGCGFVRVTNHERVTMQFRYGAAHKRLSHRVLVAAGATRKISVKLRSIHWMATWRNIDPRTGNGLRVRQNCGSTATKPSVQPSALPNTGA